jgi:UDP-N-acetylglucosamine 2-epimerase (non-hydrolysing)
MYHKKYFIPNTYRIAFIFGTRPEAIKLFPLIKELKKIKDFICIIINTGQHKEMIQQIFKSLKMDNYIDFNLDLMKKNQSLAKLTSRAISELEKIYNLIIPNAIIVQGDTTTAFSAAICAYYQKIPIFHVEAGLRTHNPYYPFPEEFNRVTIDDISTLYFAPTEWAASNLIKENKNSNMIFVTGNTIVDTLQITLNYTNPSDKITNLIEKAKLLCPSKKECKIILLTSHRRENYHRPIFNILKAIQELLYNFKDIVIIFPFHLNPNIRQSIKAAIPNIVYENIINGEKIVDSNYLHLNRFLIIPPLNYIDLVHLESQCYFIMSDSGGIQEEAVSLGKPILILRENTERPEAVKSGIGFITGISFNKIYNYASFLIINNDLYKNISKPQYIYGTGNSSVYITQIIQNYFNNNINTSISFNKEKYKDILYQYDKFSIKNDYLGLNDYKNDFYDIVIVITVWKRNNLERQLTQVKNQSFLKNKKTNIIIFQNSYHVYIDDIVKKWRQTNVFLNKVDITFIHSPIETGYFGRFIVPLTSPVRSDSYFFICDDDVIWGNRYFENMARVVNEGFLCTRNGRIITPNYHTNNAFHGKIKGRMHFCNNEDIEYDFGGHIWSGRISWLRSAWNHIPFSFENCEDFWISAVLKTYYNISTKIPKCPCPEEHYVEPDFCAASDTSSTFHQNAQVGNSSILHRIRSKFFKEITKRFNYKPLNLIKPDYVKDIHKKYKFGYNLFNLSDSVWKDALYWIG